jgi:hypothetical protein
MTFLSKIGIADNYKNFPFISPEQFDAYKTGNIAYLPDGTLITPRTSRAFRMDANNVGSPS